MVAKKIRTTPLLVFSESPHLLQQLPLGDQAAGVTGQVLDEVGGDFYDLFPVTARTWGVVIGDVCGKGPLAASRSNLARYSLRGAAVHGDSPAQTLHRVNQALLAGDT